MKTKISLNVVLITTIIFGLYSCGRRTPNIQTEDTTLINEEVLIGGFNQDGASNALFSVSDTKKVRFSKGNLQYQASTNTWRFAENQYDYVGTDNKYASSSYDGWIDLFGWGTSGWNSGAVAYQPWDTSRNHSDYFVGGRWANDLATDCPEADWAWHNTIINGGNKAHMWRTLTSSEWIYLFGESKNSSKRYGMWGNATIDNKYHGIVILPDNWVSPTGIKWISGQIAEWITNEYTIDQWTQMEEAGAIFLPAASSRFGNHILNMTPGGSYWSSNLWSDKYVYGISFTCCAFNSEYMGADRQAGLSVRPVMDYLK